MHSLKNLALSAGAVVLCGASIRSYSQEPISPVPVIINGIGFDYIPAVERLSCSEICSIVERSGGVIREIHFSSLLMFEKGCINPDYVVTLDNEKISTEYSCGGKIIAKEVYLKNGVRSLKGGAFIRASAGQWHICVIDESQKYSCGLSFRALQPKREWLSSELVDRWLLK